MSKPLSRHEVEELYGIAFPESLYAFHEFASGLPDNRLWEWLGLRLEGPLLLLTHGVDKSYADPLWRSRYYDDPPEFFTVLSGDSDGLHWGYWVDDPAAAPAEYPVAHYYSRDAFEISLDGADLFDVLRRRIESFQQDVDEDFELDGIDEEERDEVTEQMAELRSVLPRYTLAERPEIGDAYFEAYPVDIEREIVAQTPDGMGIVIPADKYLLPTISHLSEEWTLENRAAEAKRFMEDGYPGAALELGKDLWLDSERREMCYSLMDTAYAALGRDPLHRALGVARAWREHCDREEAARSDKKTP
jgi:hypothetical protein